MIKLLAVLVLLMTVFLPSISAARVDVKFLLKEASQSSSTSDYIFQCQVVGNTLQWEANNQSLGGLTSVQIRINKERIVRSSTKGMFAYSAVFLEDEESDGQNMLTSILIISTSLDYLHVTCFNGQDNSTSTTTSALLQSLNRIAVDSSNTIILQHIFSTVIVQATNASQTHVFWCRVQSNSQLWAINNRLPYGFSEFNNIGDSLPLNSSGEPVAEELAFLHAKNPIYTILLVTTTLPINVSCLTNQHEANLFLSDETTPTIPQTPPTMAYTSPVTYSNNQSSTAEDTALIEVTKDVVHNINNVPLVAGGVAAGAVVLGICAVTAITLVVICNNINSDCHIKRRSSEVLGATNPTAIDS